MGWEQYQEIMKPNGLYEGARHAKELGLIDHLCISLHCDASDVLRIIQEESFEGITISVNAMNYERWLPVLRTAHDNGIGVVTMNSLGGGVIPAYKSLFERLDQSDDPVPVKALRFLASFPEIDVLLSGMTSKAQIDENCSAFCAETLDRGGENFSIAVKERLCSGCNYCAPCTVGLPISACMQAYNHKVLVESDSQAIKPQKVANDVFIRLRAGGVGLIDLRSCIGCGMCMQRCSQKLDIIKRIHEMSDWAERYHYTQQALRSRFQELEYICRDFHKIAVWPSCDYADRVLDFLGNPEFEARCEYFNSSPALWGTRFRGKPVYSPAEIVDLGVEAVIIMNYRFQEEIYMALKHTVSSHVQLIKLHKKDDIMICGYPFSSAGKIS